MAVRERGRRRSCSCTASSTGAADRSYGIHVARLAGVPAPVVGARAEILANLERDEYGGDGLPRRARKRGEARQGQYTLFRTPSRRMPGSRGAGRAARGRSRPG